MARLGRRSPAPALRGPQLLQPQLLQILSDVTVYNVMDYGATGNGSTSDSTAIQNAINAAQSAGGGIVYMPRGAYLLTAGLVIGKSGSTYYSGITLLGDGETATGLAVAQNAAFSPITVTGDSANPSSWGYHTLQGFNIQMQSPASGSNSTAAITVQYCLFPTLTGLQLIDFATGLHCIGTNGLRAERLFIPSNSTASTGLGVYLDGTAQNAYSYFFHCNVGFGVPTVNTVSYYCSGAHMGDLYLHFCEGDTSTTGFLYDGTSAASVLDTVDIHIVQGVFDQCTNGVVIQNCSQGAMVNIDGFWFAARTSNAAGITVSNASGVHIRAAHLYSVYNANTYGIFIASSSADCSIAQCVMKGQFQQNILVSGSNYVSIFGNNITSPVSTGNSAGISVASSNNVSITGNTIRGVPGTSINTGIFLNGASKVVLLENVVDTGTVTTPFTAPSSTYTRANNIGF